MCVDKTLKMYKRLWDVGNLMPRALKEEYLPKISGLGFFHFPSRHLKGPLENREKAMAPHSSTLAWKITGMEEPGGLQSMGSLGVGHD